MRWAALAVLCMLLAACGGRPPRPYAAHESRRLEADFDQVWKITLRLLGERGFRAESADRAAGIIRTDWLTVNPAYEATIFVTRREDRYADCGKPGLWQAFQGKQARLELALSPVRQHDTQLSIQARYRTALFSDPWLWRGKYEGEVECQSRGRLEEEVVLQIQLQLVGERLERLRRGNP